MIVHAELVSPKESDGQQSPGKTCCWIINRLKYVEQVRQEILK
jgi:hypothetical protein